MRLNLHPILRASRTFYREHDLAPWADAIPDKATASDADAERLLWAEKAGWTEAFAFPPFALQMETLPCLIEATARKQAAQLSDDQQYAVPPFLADTMTREANGRIVQRTTDLAGRETPYLLIYSRGPITNAWGRSGRQIVELLDSKDWRGLTIPEYLVLQRFLCERDRHHLFYDGEAPERRGHWLWLADSATDKAMSVGAWLYGAVNIQACPLGHRDAKRATIGALVVGLLDEP